MLHELGELLDYGNHLSVRGERRRQEGMKVAIYQGVDFGGTLERDYSTS